MKFYNYKSLITALSLTIVFLLSINLNLAGQEIKHLKAGDSYSLFKVDIDNKEVVFRSDRIEIIQYDRNSRKQRKFDHLIFTQNIPTAMEPVGLIDETIEEISNKAMANVLGLSNMNVATYKKLIYKNVFPNIDLGVSVSDNELVFEYIGSSQEDQTVDFKLSGYDLFYSKEKSDQFTLSDKHSDLVSISATTTKIDKDVVSIVPTKDSKGNKSFSLIIR